MLLKEIMAKQGNRRLLFGVFILFVHLGIVTPRRFISKPPETDSAMEVLDQLSSPPGSVTSPQPSIPTEDHPATPAADISLLDLENDVAPYLDPSGSKSFHIEHRNHVRVHLTQAINILGSNYSTVFISGNGLVSFEKEIKYFENWCNKVTAKVPTISAYTLNGFEHSGYGNTAKLFHRQDTNGSSLSTVSRDVVTAFPELQGSLSLNWMLLVTWENIPPNQLVGERDLTNSFQMVLTTDGVQSFVLFYYKSITWPVDYHEHAEAGIYGGPKNLPNSYVISNSCTPSILNITSTSNIGVPGKYVFRVDNELKLPALSPCLPKSSAPRKIQFEPEGVRSLGSMLIFSEELILCPNSQVTEVKCTFHDRSRQDPVTVTGFMMSPQMSAVCPTPEFYSLGRVRVDMALTFATGENISTYGFVVVGHPVLDTRMRLDITIGRRKLLEAKWLPASDTHRLFRGLSGGLIDVGKNVNLTLMEFKEGLWRELHVFRNLPNSGTWKGELPKDLETGLLSEESESLPRAMKISSSVVKNKTFVYNFESVAIAEPTYALAKSKVNGKGANIFDRKCKEWHDSELSPPTDTLPCPISMEQAEMDCRFSKEKTLAAIMNPENFTMFLQSTPSPSGAGSQCFYNGLGKLISGYPHGSRLHRRSPNNVNNTWSHYLEDVLPYLHCCQLSSKKTDNCKNYFFAKRPPNSGQGCNSQLSFLVTSAGQVSTLNGVTYQMTGNGHLWLLHIPGQLEIQIWTETYKPLYPYPEGGVATAVITSFGTNGTVTKFQVSANPTYGFLLWMDDERLDLLGDRFNIINEIINEDDAFTLFHDGVTVTQTGNGISGTKTATFSFSSGVTVKFLQENYGHGRSLSVLGSVSTAWTGQATGLVGNHKEGQDLPLQLCVSPSEALSSVPAVSWRRTGLFRKTRSVGSQNDNCRVSFQLTNGLDMSAVSEISSYHLKRLINTTRQGISPRTCATPPSILNGGYTGSGCSMGTSIQPRCNDNFTLQVDGNTSPGESFVCAVEGKNRATWTSQVSSRSLINQTIECVGPVEDEDAELKGNSTVGRSDNGAEMEDLVTVNQALAMENDVPYLNSSGSNRFYFGNNEYKGIDLEKGFNFLGRNYTTAFVSGNGLISFKSGIRTIRYGCNKSNARYPTISTYMANSDNRFGDAPATAKLLYRQDTNGSFSLSKVSKDVHTAFPELRGAINLNWMLLVTWENIPSHLEPHLRNTFQAVLTTDGMHSFVLFYYKDISWPIGSRVAEAGIYAGNQDSQNSYILPTSCTPALVNVTSTSNIGVSGKYVFRVDNSLKLPQLSPCIEKTTGAAAFHPNPVQFRPLTVPAIGSVPVFSPDLSYCPSSITAVSCVFHDTGSPTTVKMKGSVIPGQMVAICPTPTFYSLGRIRVDMSLELASGDTLAMQGHVIVVQPGYSESFQIVLSRGRDSNDRKVYLDATWKEYSEDFVPQLEQTFDVAKNVTLTLLELRGGRWTELQSFENIPNTGEWKSELPKDLENGLLSETSETLPRTMKLSRTLFIRNRFAFNVEQVAAIGQSSISLSMVDTPFMLESAESAKKLSIKAHKECKKWYEHEPSPPSDTLPCPTTRQLAEADWRFSKNPALLDCTNSLSFAIYIQTNPSPSGAGAQCSYDDRGNLVIGYPYGSRLHRSSPNKRENIWSHYSDDLVPYLQCCYFNYENGDNCKYNFFGKRPPNMGVGYKFPVPFLVASAGQVSTLDRNVFQINGTGQIWGLHFPGHLELQVTVDELLEGETAPRGAVFRSFGENGTATKFQVWSSSRGLLLWMNDTPFNFLEDTRKGEIALFDDQFVLPEDSVAVTLSSGITAFSFSSGISLHFEQTSRYRNGGTLDIVGSVSREAAGSLEGLVRWDKDVGKVCVAKNESLDVVTDVPFAGSRQLESCDIHYQPIPVNLQDGVYNNLQFQGLMDASKTEARPRSCRHPPRISNGGFAGKDWIVGDSIQPYCDGGYSLRIREKIYPNASFTCVPDPHFNNDNETIKGAQWMFGKWSVEASRIKCVPSEGVQTAGVKVSPQVVPILGDTQLRITIPHTLDKQKVTGITCSFISPLKSAHSESQGEIEKVSGGESKVICPVLVLQALGKTQIRVEIQYSDSPSVFFEHHFWVRKMGQDETKNYLKVLKSQYRGSRFTSLCKQWYEQAEDRRSLGSSMLPPCPRTVAQAEVDWRFSREKTHFSGAAHVFTQSTPSILKSGAQCAYDANGGLLFGAPAGSRVQRFSSNGWDSYWDHYTNDTLPYLVCCKWSKRAASNCNQYFYKKREISVHSIFQRYTPPKFAVSWGATHIQTFSGTRYQVRGSGEILMMKYTHPWNTLEQFECQVKVEPYTAVDDSMDYSVITGVAMQQSIPGTDEVSVRVTQNVAAAKGFDVLVNDNLLEVEELEVLYHEGVTVFFNRNASISEALVSFQLGFSVKVRVSLGVPGINVIFSANEDKIKGLLADTGKQNENKFGMGVVFSSEEDTMEDSLGSSRENNGNDAGMNWQVPPNQSLFSSYPTHRTSGVQPLELEIDTSPSTFSSICDISTECQTDWKTTGSEAFGRAGQEVLSQFQHLMRTSQSPVCECEVPEDSHPDGRYVITTLNPGSMLKVFYKEKSAEFICTRKEENSSECEWLSSPDGRILYSWLPSNFG